MLLGVAVLLAASCGANLPLGTSVATKDPLAGAYIARGGGGALDNVGPLIKEFTKLHPTMTWQGLDDIGSDAGVKLVQSGEIDLSFISRDLKPAEVGTVTTVPIGQTGTGIVVNAANPVMGLTKDQLAKIFRGEITDWSGVGGPPGPIRVFMREVGAATRNALESYLFGGKPPAAYPKSTIEVGSYAEILKSMHNFSGSISIVSMSAQAIAEPTIHLLAVDGIAATHQMLASGKYPMSRPLFFVYSNDPAKVKPAIKAFMDWVKGPQGQGVLDSL
jgi:phosphate transport system substrate-binding protein